MKKVYEKPILHVEYFTLNQSIAAGCGAAHNSDWGGPSWYTKATCGWRLPDGETIVWASKDACSEVVGVDDQLDGICYHNPDGGYTIFSS